MCFLGFLVFLFFLCVLFFLLKLLHQVPIISNITVRMSDTPHTNGPKTLEEVWIYAYQFATWVELAIEVMPSDTQEYEHMILAAREYKVQKKNNLNTVINARAISKDSPEVQTNWLYDLNLYVIPEEYKRIDPGSDWWSVTTDTSPMQLREHGKASAAVTPKQKKPAVQSRKPPPSTSSSKGKGHQVSETPDAEDEENQEVDELDNSEHPHITIEEGGVSEDESVGSKDEYVKSTWVSPVACKYCEDHETEYEWEPQCMSYNECRCTKTKYSLFLCKQFVSPTGRKPLRKMMHPVTPAVVKAFQARQSKHHGKKAIKSAETVESEDEQSDDEEDAPVPMTGTSRVTRSRDYFCQDCVSTYYSKSVQDNKAEIKSWSWDFFTRIVDTWSKNGVNDCKVGDICSNSRSDSGTSPRSEEEVHLLELNELVHEEPIPGSSNLAEVTNDPEEMEVTETLDAPVSAAPTTAPPMTESISTTLTAPPLLFGSISSRRDNNQTNNSVMSNVVATPIYPPPSTTSPTARSAVISTVTSSALMIGEEKEAVAPPLQHVSLYPFPELQNLNMTESLNIDRFEQVLPSVAGLSNYMQTEAERSRPESAIATRIQIHPLVEEQQEFNHVMEKAMEHYKEIIRNATGERRHPLCITDEEILVDIIDNGPKIYEVPAPPAGMAIAGSAFQLPPRTTAEEAATKVSYKPWMTDTIITQKSVWMENARAIDDMATYVNIIVNMNLHLQYQMFRQIETNRQTFDIPFQMLDDVYSLGDKKVWRAETGQESDPSTRHPDTSPPPRTFTAQIEDLKARQDAFQEHVLVLLHTAWLHVPEVAV
ncbi:hypothetical protein C8Q75DRAFT_737349 [Abortiporus biennis]|nr:hypothetical protein C8Q75DRAFT_737349 [Abortiporus biennis]